MNELSHVLFIYFFFRVIVTISFTLTCDKIVDSSFNNYLLNKIIQWFFIKKNSIKSHF